MSHNASALVLTDDVNLIRGNMTYNFAAPLNISNCQLSNYNQYLGNPNQDLVCYVRSVALEIPTESYIVGDYLTFPVYIFNSQNNNSSDATFQSISINTSGWDLVDVQYQNLTSSVGVANITLKNYIAGSYNLFTLTSTSGNAFSNLQYGEYLASGKATHWRPRGNVDYSSAINSVVNAINNSPDYTSSLNNIQNKIDNINNDVEDATQDASDAAQDSADDAQADNEAATSSLLSVITGFFGAMANLNPTNCKFDSHLPFLSGNGQIDLCQVPAPPVVQAIGSLILIGIMVPFAIHMYNRFISITGSFQR